MSYPQTVVASLLEIQGSSCGSLTNEMTFDSGASSPQYNRVAGGDFLAAELKRKDLGSQQYTWTLSIRNMNAGACRGVWHFTRVVEADDPLGDYGIVDVNGDADTDAGAAGVVEP